MMTKTKHLIRKPRAVTHPKPRGHLDRVIIDCNSPAHTSIGMDPESVGLKDIQDLNQQALVEYASMGGKNIEVVNERNVLSFGIGDIVREVKKSIFNDRYWSN